MAVAGNARVVSWIAAGDLSTKQYYFMKQSTTAGEVTTSGASTHAGGDKPKGVLINKPTAQGQIAEVAQEGRCLVVVGTAVAEGALIRSDANGKAETAATDKDFACGIAMQAGDASDIIEIELGPYSKQSI